MKIHGTSVSVPALESLDGSGVRSAKLWDALRGVGSLVSISPAPLPEPQGFLYRLMAWARFPAPLRFSKVNLRPEVFGWRSAAALKRIRGKVALSKAEVILEEGFFFSPHGASLPYAVYTDATGAMVDRHYYSQVPWIGSDLMKRKWMRQEKELYSNAIAVFTYSEFCKKSVCNDYGIPTSRVEVVYPGLNFAPHALTREKAERPLRVIFVGYDFKRKGGDVLLKAWSEVLTHVPEAELLIVGPAYDRISPPGVIFLGQVDSREQISALYLSADIFCMPSIFEPYGHVFLEAMAHGLPCIGTECCAMPEIIRPRYNGLLAAPGDAASLAACITLLLKDDSLRERLRQGALSTAASWNSWKHVANRIVNRLTEEFSTPS